MREPLRLDGDGYISSMLHVKDRSHIEIILTGDFGAKFYSIQKQYSPISKTERYVLNDESSKMFGEELSQEMSFSL